MLKVASGIGMDAKWEYGALPLFPYFPFRLRQTGKKYQTSLQQAEALRQSILKKVR